MFQSNYGSDFNLGASQFGAAGGFVPSPAADAGQGTQGAKRFGNTLTLRAVTVRQLVEAVAKTPDDNITVDGEELNNVTIVGRITSVQETATNFEFEIDDGTGKIKVNYFMENEEEILNAKRQECREGVYVRIHGHLRSFDNKQAMVAFNIRAITDFNEVTYHFLACIYQHAHFIHGTARPNGAAAVPSEPKPNVGGATAGGVLAGGDGPSDPVQAAVLQVFNSASRVFTTDQVVQALNNRWNVHQVRDAIIQLADEGSVYSTTDDAYRSCSV